MIVGHVLYIVYILWLLLEIVFKYYFSLVKSIQISVSATDYVATDLCVSRRHYDRTDGLVEIHSI